MYEFTEFDSGGDGCVKLILIENIVLSENELEELELEKERLLWREFWTYKNGGVYSDGFDKTVVRKTSLTEKTEKSRESVFYGKSLQIL